jgi:hypothetical protein
MIIGALVILLIVSMVRSKSSAYTIELRKDSPDNTIKTLKLTADKCKEECDKTNGCVGFVSYSIGDVCMLKSSVSNMVDKMGSSVFVK